jgi:hypothetical protein
MRILALLAAAFLLAAQQPPEIPVDFVCPMDPEVHAKDPGKCPRCGMRLVAGIPDPVEYPVDLRLSPRVPSPGEPLEMVFRVENPRTRALVTKFDVVHEKLFHLFLVSEDLSYFAHEHPEHDGEGTYRFRTTLPKAGPYRVVSDFYPTGATPQMHVSTIVVPGAAAPPAPLAADLTAKTGSNLHVELVTEPAKPLAGFKTLMFFQLKPAKGDFQLEQYLGAWGHMLAASGDLIDLIHTHPFLADGGPRVQFNVIFPREGVYRVWVQFQSRGEVNTVAFNVPVAQLR